MKKLFLSYSSLLRQVYLGKVTAEDLSNGFFMFGCTRGHAFNPGAAGETDERQWNNGQNAVSHPVIIDALVKAEQDGRAGWMRPDAKVRRDAFEVLNEMLTKHQMEPLEPSNDPDWNYCYPGMAQCLAESLVPLVAVY